MAEAAAMKLAVSSGYQVVKSGTGKITEWIDRARGLKLLKNLPKGPLEAFVFGEDDVTPELLAALSLGGTPGIQLSTIALLKANNFALFSGDQSWMSEVDSPPGEDKMPRSLMDGDFHYFIWLDNLPRQMRVHVFRDDYSSSVKMRLGGSGATVSNLEVVAYARTPDLSRGLVVRSQGDGLHYYCENRRGELELSDIDVPIPGIDVNLSNFGSRMFVVSPRVLKEYTCFQRLHKTLHRDCRRIVEWMGLTRVGKKLGENFVRQIAGDGKSLLSRQFMRDIHCNPRRCTPSLKMPTDEELRTRVEEEITRLPLSDRDATWVFFPAMQEIISSFVKNIESEAAKRGNVEVRKKNEDSSLIRSCIVQAAGMESTFAIFDGFRKHKLNIAVSPGCTAVYFPGLSLTVAFPEGHEVQSRRVVLRSACPFSTDLQESLPILLELAPKVVRNTLVQFAKTLSSELAKDPALALSPVTEGVVRAISPRGRPCDALYLTDIFNYIKKRKPESTWGEASVAGILCQLGLTFAVPSRKESGEVEDFRCFFQVCREVWPSTCVGAELVVDCGVDISGCDVSRVEMPLEDHRRGFFLTTLACGSSSMVSYEMTGEVANVPWDELHELRGCVCFLHRSPEFLVGRSELVRIPVPCHVTGFGRPREERAGESKTE